MSTICTSAGGAKRVSTCMASFARLCLPATGDVPWEGIFERACLPGLRGDGKMRPTDIVWFGEMPYGWTDRAA
jgi:hypothetical protein